MFRVIFIVKACQGGVEGFESIVAVCGYVKDESYSRSLCHVGRGFARVVVPFGYHSVTSDSQNGLSLFYIFPDGRRCICKCWQVVFFWYVWDSTVSYPLDGVHSINGFTFRIMSLRRFIGVRVLTLLVERRGW